MRQLRWLVVALLALGLTACAQSENGGGPFGGASATSGSTLGTVGGAVLGGLAGSRVGGGSGKLASVAAGTLLGAYLGRQLGQKLDEDDQAAAGRAERNALSSNSSVTWSNPDSDHRGTVQPVRTFEKDGRTCREYVHTIYIEGQAEEARGTACQTADGGWEVVK